MRAVSSLLLAFSGLVILGGGLRSSLSMLRRALAFGAVLQLFSACDQWSLMVNSDGLLFISIVGDSNQPGNAFRVRARQTDGTTRVLDLPASRQFSLSDLGSGPLELTLLAPETCRVSEPNPRTVTPDANGMISVAFEVHCSR